MRGSRPLRPLVTALSPLSARFREWFRTHRFARAVLMMSGGAAIGQAVVLGSTPILTRLYSPHDFGTLAVFTSVLMTMGVVANLRYDFAVPVADEDETGAVLVQLALFATVVMASLTGLVVWWASRSQPVLPGFEGLWPYLWLVPVSVLGTGVYQAFYGWAVRRRNYRSIAVTNATQSVWMVGAQLALAFVTAGPLGLLIGASLRSMGGSLRLVFDAWRADRASLRVRPLELHARAAARFRKFPLISAPSSFLNSWGLQLPHVLMAALFSLEIAGAFFIAHKLIAIPITFLGRGVTSAYVGEASGMIRSEPAAARRLFRSSVRELARIGVVPALVLLVAGAPLTTFALGPDWQLAGTFLQVLAIMFLVKFSIQPLTHTLVLLQRQEVQLGWDVARLVLVNGSIVIAALLGGSAVYGVLVYGATMALSYVGYYVLADGALRRREAAGP